MATLGEMLGLGTLPPLASVQPLPDILPGEPPPEGGTSIVDTGLPYQPSPYEATLPPMLEPGLLTREQPQSGGPGFGGSDWGDPRALWAPSAAAALGGLGTTGLGLQFTAPQAARGIAEAALPGSSEAAAELAKGVAGAGNLMLNSQANVGVMNPRDVPITGPREAYDKYSIPLVTGAIEGAADPLNYAGSPGQLVKPAVDAARAISHAATPVKEALTPAARAIETEAGQALQGWQGRASRGEAPVNPFSELGKTPEPEVVPSKNQLKWIPLSDEQKAPLLAELESHEVRDTAELFARNKIVAEEGGSTLAAELLSKEHLTEDEAVQAGYLAAMAMRAGDSGAAAALARKGDASYRPAAQMLQSAGGITGSSLSPEAILNTAQRTLDVAAEDGNAAAVKANTKNRAVDLGVRLAKEEGAATSEAIGAAEKASKEVQSFTTTGGEVDDAIARAKALEDKTRALLKANERVMRAEDIIGSIEVNGKIEPRTAAAVERVQELKDYLKPFETANRAEERMAGRVEALERNGVTLGDIPELIAASNERAQQVRDELNAYNRARQSMIDAEAKGIHLQGQIDAGIAPSMADVTAGAARAKTELERLRAYQKDLAWLTDVQMRAVKPRVQNDMREMVARAKRILGPAGIELTPVQGNYFLDTAKKIADMGNPAAGTDEAAQKWLLENRLMGDMAALVPLKFHQQVLDWLGLPRALKAAFDMSMPLRQGILAVGSPAWYKAWGPMVHAAIDPKYYDTEMARLMTRPLAKRGQDAGIYVSGIASRHEEGFASSLLSKFGGRNIPFTKTEIGDIPVAGGTIRVPGLLYDASERNATMFVNKLRTGMFDSMVSRLENKWGQALTPEQDRQIAEYINAVTGRGGKIFDSHRAGLLNDMLGLVFFSPRNWVSRLEAPALAARAAGSLAVGGMTPAAYSVPVAKMISFEAGKTLGLLGTVFSAAALAGHPVDADWLSSNFGKIRVGNTYHDLLGGEAQSFRYIAQIAAKKLRRPNGKEVPLTDEEQNAQIGRMIRSKLNPVAGLIPTWMTGTDFMGKPTNPMNELVELIKPGLSWQIIGDAAQAGVPPVGTAALAAESFLGAGVQAYKGLLDVQNEEANRAFGKNYEALAPSEKTSVDSADAVQKVMEPLTQAPKPEVSERVAGAQYAENINRIESGFVKNYNSMLPGDAKGRREAIKDMLTARRQAFDDTLGNPLTLRSQGKPVTEENMAAYYNNLFMTRDMPMKDGEPDFAAYKAEGNRIIAEALRQGVPEKETTYHKPLKDAQAEKIVSAYRDDMKTLEPYWELKDKLLQAVPAFDKIAKQVDAAETKKDTRALENLKDQPIWDLYQETLDAQKELLRRRNKPVEEALLRWGYNKNPVGGEPNPYLPGPTKGTLDKLEEQNLERTIAINRSLAPALGNIRVPAVGRP